MPVLSNARHERFAQGIAAGKTADQAYQDAGYKPSRQNASTLRTNQTVSDRVAELQERAAVRTEITIAIITDMLLADRKLARENAQASAAVSATEKLAKLHGLMVDRTINENYDYLVSDEPVSADDPDTWLASSRPN